ncbi:hypothetical protein OGM63_07775 [Plectonema radiosum NIES-515]|uniref:Uncharacterized protein n=1 Tax=Plectonema radiosum NIES-515 TaxID=2986073 RepID=A0ABT3AWH0_9CYAN|nr:hypothetical protein [Plectonema radiosum]MCV3213425.1 hypothetical protein [Plectonema radiosum NIES-515]
MCTLVALEAGWRSLSPSILCKRGCQNDGYTMIQMDVFELYLKATGV